MSFDLQTFAQSIREDGYCIVENVLSPEFVSQAKKELEIAIEKEMEYHGTSEYSDYGMVLLCAIYGGSFIKILFGWWLFHGM